MDPSLGAMFPMFCLRWPQLGAKLSPKVPSCVIWQLTWTSMCITWLQYGVHLWSVWARLHPNMTHFGPSWGSSSGVQDRAAWDQAWAQPDPILRTQCDALKICLFTATVQRFLALIFDGGSCKAMLPTLGLSWAQLQRQMPPHRTKFRMLSPTCVQTCPIAPCWTEFGASYAAQLKAKDRQVWPQSAFGWAK